MDPFLIGASSCTDHQAPLFQFLPRNFQGKSYLAKAVATESDATFFSVSSSDLISTWQGRSEKLVKTLFDLAHEYTRAVIFIDEIDALCSSRSQGDDDSSRRVKTTFLTMMDGIHPQGTQGAVLVLAATNCPWELDIAMRRRLVKRVHIALPDKDARIRLLELSIGNNPCSLTESEYDKLGESTNGASGSDIKVMVKEAKVLLFHRCKEAKKFRPDMDGKLIPCDNVPNCENCPRKHSSDPPGKNYICSTCGAMHMMVDDKDVPADKRKLLKLPSLTLDAFETILKQKSICSVSPTDLNQYDTWTQSYGQQG
eukprot:scaffold79782_cov34-Attheya_sp.AAC.2